MAWLPTCTRMPVITMELLLFTASTVKPKGLGGSLCRTQRPGNLGVGDRLPYLGAG